MCTYEQVYSVTQKNLCQLGEEWWFRSIMYKLMLIFDSLLNYAVNPQNSQKKRVAGAGRGIKWNGLKIGK